MKGDDERERNYFAEVAHRAGMRLLCPDPATDARSRASTPQQQEFYGEMDRGEAAEHVAEGLELGGSEEDSMKYFGGKGVSFLIASEEAGGPFASYREHYDFVASKDKRERMGFGQRASEHADQVKDHLRIMGSIQSVNGPATQIDFGKVCTERQLVYVDLDGPGSKRAHMLSKQVLFDIRQAAQKPRRRRKNHVFFIADEADLLVRSAGVVDLFNRIRHRGMSIILSHQYAEQTGDHGVGLDVNCLWTVDFGQATAEAVEKMQAYAPPPHRDQNPNAVPRLS